MTAQVRVGGLLGYTGLVESLRGDPQQLLRDCGIAPDLLEDDDALIPYRQLIYLLEHTATELAVPDFGLRLAGAQDIGILGPLAVAMQNSSTVEDALLCAASHLFLQSRALSLDIEKLSDSVRLRIQIKLNNMPHRGMRQTEDLAIGITHGIVKFLAQEHFHALRVELPHEPLLIESSYQAFFGVSVIFSCAQNALYLEKSVLTTSLRQRSAQLHQLAADYIDAQLPNVDGRLSSRVEIAIRRTLGTESCDRNSVARAMAMHPRTLQRHLEREGETFDRIRDAVRREKAEHYLCNTDLPLSQVARIIGYREQSILSRSCQRWFGMTPRKVRVAQ